jgi:hypothetical protein
MYICLGQIAAPWRHMTKTPKYIAITLIPQLQVSHRHSAELMSKLIQLISALISAQLKWKVILAVSGLLSVDWTESDSILKISN